MSLIDTVSSFIEQDEKGERAVFEAAMEARIMKEGFRMADLCYEVYRAQSSIASLARRFEALEAKIAHKACKSAQALKV